MASDGSKLTLRGVLHYLWDQAELTRWQPGFAGKRSWATVRKHLLQAAEGKIARGWALQDRLYVPEVFSVEQREQINGRRIAQWTRTLTTKAATRPLMLLVAELREVTPARYGCKVVLKHVRGRHFALDEKLYARMARRFAPELSMWGASDTVRMIVIATFGMTHSGVPSIDELSLMPVNAQWIPVDNPYELQLVDRLVREGRCFRKGLRYNLGSHKSSASVVLTDAPSGPVAMYVTLPADSVELNDDAAPPMGDHRTTRWVWAPAREPMPDIPPPQQHDNVSGTARPTLHGAQPVRVRERPTPNASP